MDESADSERESVDPERVCLACGICCKGGIFEYVAIADDELDRVRRHLPIIPGDGEISASYRHRVNFGCPAHDGARCTVYEDRPGLCATYQCNLITKLERREMTTKNALDVVAQARALFDRLDGVLPNPGPGVTIWERARALKDVAEGSLDDRRAAADVLLDLAALEQLLIRRFDTRARREEPKVKGPKS